jgi:AcrR family transcriptional regulator
VGHPLRNAEATKERILDAAMDEFSSYGIAGARVDRIAKSAGCNKNLIYIYFGNKETLFTTVLEENLIRVYEEIADFTPEDLPGYAARVFDFAMTHPKLFRLMAWNGLEQKVGNLTERASTQEKKLKEIKNAQSSGLIGNTFTPGFLMTFIMSLATAWLATNPFGPSYDPDVAKNPIETRDAISKAVSLIVKSNN